MSFIAVDDTDSRAGMCTTYLMAKLIRKINSMGIDVIGYPCLVRLNPNVPYKTRGNGALCIRFGQGKGDKFPIMKWRGKSYYGHALEKHLYDRGQEKILQNKIEKKVFHEACGLIESDAEMEMEETNPGVVMFSEKPDIDIYEKAVREILKISQIEKYIHKNNGLFRKFKRGRGIIGAAAACSWEPGDYTFELIGYRSSGNFGKKRYVNEESVKKMDKMYPSTFDNYDYGNRHNSIIPTSPCPVLLGIRGETADELAEANCVVQGEESQGFVIFITNQGTDDHLVEKKIEEVKTYQSVKITGKVTKIPNYIKGGHVVFSVKDKTGIIDCTAYEPTKEFRQTVMKLEHGDLVTVCGSVRQEPFTVNLEKLEVIELVERKRKVSNPKCENCGKNMKSAGAKKGYRCIRCGARAGEDMVVYEKYVPEIGKGWYEVPVCARRHLAKPLKRYENQY